MNLNHPFALDISDLENLTIDLEEQLTDKETAQIGGGTTLTTLALGEEGGYPGGIVCISAPCPGSESGESPYPYPLPKPPKPPVYTKAWAEGGGGHYTKALCETGSPIFW
jgi:hypothetical protein